METDSSDFDPAQFESATALADIVSTSSRRETASTRAPTLALADGEAVTVPALEGLTVREVSEQCARLGISPVLVGTGVALEEVPEAGTTVRRGSRVTVRFGRPARPSRTVRAQERNN